MDIGEFELERYFARHEFAARHVLAGSDVEGLAMTEVLAMADDDGRARWSNLSLGYTESAGLPALRAEVAALYPGCSPDDVLMFAGAQEGIFLTMHAALSSGDHAVVVQPAYQSLHEVAVSIGVSVTNVDLDPASWRLDLAEVATAIRDNTRMVVINFPHNPTGAHLDSAQLGELVELCRARGIILFSDEVYRLLEHDAADLLEPVASLYENGVSLGVMSKAFALAGLRVGWIVTHNRELRTRIAALKDYTTICNSAPSEVLALIALRARDRVLARSREIVHRNLPVLHAFIDRHGEHLSWAPPRAGSVCFPRFRHGADAARAAELFVAQAGVLILPGSCFQYDRSYFRVGFGRHDTAEALSLIDPLIERAASIR